MDPHDAPRQCGNEANLSSALICESPWLFRELYRFNFAPADYLHPSRRPSFMPALRDPAVWDCSRARPGLSLHILDKTGLAGTSSFDPRIPEWPLLLLDAERLQRLARHIGAAVLGPRVRRAITRAEVLQWKGLLGPQLYQFSMTATLFPQPEQEPELEGSHPIESLGYRWIDISLRAAPESLLARSRLKYPDWVEKTSDTSPKAKLLTWAVLRTLERKWYSLFAQRAAQKPLSP